VIAFFAVNLALPSLEGTMADIYGDAANNNLFGKSESLYGQGGNDNLMSYGSGSLFGGDGDDILESGGRDRFLTGGAGADRFVGRGSELDILDFTSGVDTIVLTKNRPWGWDFTNVPTGIVTNSMFRTGPGVTTAADADDFLIYDSRNGVLYYDADATGVTAGVVVLLLEPAVPLRASDIEIVAINVVTGTTSNDQLSGTSGPDSLNGLQGNDSFYGGAGNDRLNGSEGIDVAVYAGLSTDFQIQNLSGNHNRDMVVIDNNTQDRNEGIDFTDSVERLRFQDHAVATDVVYPSLDTIQTANAGAVAKVIGAVFGAPMVKNLTLVGQGLYHLDRLHDYSGGRGVDRQSYQALAQLALDAKLGANATDRQVVDLLFTNVIGRPPSNAEAQRYLDLLANGTYTQATLGMMAADSSDNWANIDFVGLIANGLPYQEII
jgi:Ca2+-binding RTX toxin-like protein